MKKQNQIIVLLSVFYLSIIIVISSFVYVSISNYLNIDFFQLLKIRATTNAQLQLGIINQSHSQNISSINDDLSEKLFHEKDYLYELSQKSHLQEEAKRLNLPISFFEKIQKEGEAEYKDKGVYFKGILYTNQNQKYIAIASAENHMEQKLTSYLQRVLLFAILATLLLSILGAVYFSKHFLKPIAAINKRVKQISSENLHLRLETSNRNDEINKLALTFNDMLNRIETSFETQNNFISNASHELRTPLTAIIGEADVCLSKERTPEEYVETIKVLLDEAEKLERKTQALLYLAQTGFNGTALKFEKIRADQLIWDVKETLEKINSNNRIIIDVSLLPENPAKLKIRGNEQLLHLAITNIVSNACKYSNYKEVIISLGASDSNVFIVIKDSGIGIPNNELKYIYDPFFRASNTKKYEGYGIGLPLTQNIINMHKGKISVNSKENIGTTVQLELPTWNETV